MVLNIENDAIWNIIQNAFDLSIGWCKSGDFDFLKQFCF